MPPKSLEEDILYTNTIFIYKFFIWMFILYLIIRYFWEKVFLRKGTKMPSMLKLNNITQIWPPTIFVFPPSKTSAGPTVNKAPDYLRRLPDCRYWVWRMWRWSGTYHGSQWWCRRSRDEIRWRANLILFVATVFQPFHIPFANALSCSWLLTAVTASEMLPERVKRKYVAIPYNPFFNLIITK